jgi:hypothetical protein
MGGKVVTSDQAHVIDEQNLIIDGHNWIIDDQIPVKQLVCDVARAGAAWNAPTRKPLCLRLLNSCEWRP